MPGRRHFLDRGGHALRSRGASPGRHGQPRSRDLHRRPIAFEQRLRGVDVPVLVTHGVMDKVSDIRMARHTASLIPGSRLSEYNFIGHAPFWEDAPRFNRELAELVRSARR